MPEKEPTHVNIEVNIPSWPAVIASAFIAALAVFYMTLRERGKLIAKHKKMLDKERLKELMEQDDIDASETAVAAAKEEINRLSKSIDSHAAAIKDIDSKQTEFSKKAEKALSWADVLEDV